MTAGQIEALKNKIVELEHPDKIILFGSHATGAATEESDVDLLVISDSTLSRPDREISLTRKLFGSGVPFDLFFLTPAEVEERVRRNGPFIREILSRGKVLYDRAA
jgi:uncharacterized protein